LLFSSLPGRWLFWIYLIVFGAHWFIIYFFMPETRDTIGEFFIVESGEKRSKELTFVFEPFHS